MFELQLAPTLELPYQRWKMNHDSKDSRELLSLREPNLMEKKDRDTERKKRA